MRVQKVVIIIPTYNEAEIIEKTISEIFQATATNVDMHINLLVFDSGSTDTTQDVIAKLQALNKCLYLQTEEKKSGLGSAYLSAMRYALDVMQADIVVEFDADLSHQPKYLPFLLEKMKGYDVAIGSRYVPGGSVPADWGWQRKLLSKLGNYTARLMLTWQYKDFTSGFRATRRLALMKVLPAKFLSANYAYKLELLWLLHKNHAKIVEYPIDFVNRQLGVSKLPANSIFDALSVLVKLRFLEAKNFFKMCLVGCSGIIVQCVIYNVLRQNLSPISAARYAVLAALINGFILNSRFTFKQRRFQNNYQKLKALFLFAGYSVLTIMGQSYWLQLGIKYFGAGKLRENIIMLSGIAFGSIINYIAYSRVVWKIKHPSVLI